MKLKFLFLTLIISSFLKKDYRVVESDNFNLGENYEYKIKWGFIQLGVATVSMDKKVHTMNKRPCYRVNVEGRTAGITSLFKIKNSYLSYFDTLAFVPHKFYYHARENSYRRDQELTFNHAANQVLKLEKGQVKKYRIPDNVQDVISGYYYLRTLDYSKVGQGKIVMAPLFFDDELYNLKIEFLGKEQIHTNFGKVMAYKLQPALPPNKMFKGDSGVRIWVSDDRNRVPLKIEVDFGFGTVDMELKRYKNVKYPFYWKK